MQNKFEEALENNCKYNCVDYERDGVRYCNTKLGCITKNTLKELINKYNSLKEDYQSYKDIKQEYEDKITKLEKALDKACEKMFFKRVFDGMTPDNIKEYLLKESEKQQ